MKPLLKHKPWTAAQNPKEFRVQGLGSGFGYVEITPIMDMENAMEAGVIWGYVECRDCLKFVIRGSFAGLLLQCGPLLWGTVIQAKQQ